MSNSGNDNPFQAPSILDVARTMADASKADIIRNAHLRHEASIKGVGSLNILGGSLLLFSGLFLVVMSLSTAPGDAPMVGYEPWMLILVLLLLLGMGGLQLAVGLGLRKLRPRVKIPATVIAVLWLSNIPLGTLIGLYVLFLLHSTKGSVVLSESYQDVIAQTPNIKYKTSIVVKVLAGILFAVMALGIGAAVFGGR